METDKNINAEEILKLWRTPGFSGSFTGAENFRHALESEKDIKISRNELYKILRKDPDYVLEMKQVRKTFPRRPMKVHGVGILWQADLGIMYSFENFTSFLLCIDVFSRKLFVRALKSKESGEVKEAFKEIFDEAKVIPKKLETDRGSEFLGNRQFFNQKKIFFKTKIGRHKAAFAEKGIQTVKRRLYRLLRALLTKNWPKYLPTVVDDINNTPNIAIGGLRPSAIKGPEDGPKIDKAVGLIEDTSFQEQLARQKIYEETQNKFQKGDFVHVDFGPSAFEKGFDTPNYQLFEITAVDAGKSPPLYKLIDLKKDPVPGYYYKEQLTLASEPRAGETFKIEDILKKTWRKGVKWVYVKYMHYPSKFNEWIPYANVVNTDDASE